MENIFNRNLLKKRRNKIAANWDNFNFLKEEATLQLIDCLADVKRDFHNILDIGCHKQELARFLSNKNIISTDFAENMQPDIVCDEEFLPFKSDSFDLVTCILSLHHVNDLLGSLIQIRHALRNDGLFIAIIYGANSLIELRNSVAIAASKNNKALYPSVSPFLEIRDAGSLLQRAGFALPVINSEIIKVQYKSVYNLFQDLKNQGESNILNAQYKGLTCKNNLQNIVSAYQENFIDEQGLFPASFEFITMTAWKPDISQPKPLKRGSAQVNLQDVL